MALGATRSPSLAYDIAKATAKELRAVGINWNFAPVLDVLTDSKEPVVTVRSFSDDPQVVGKFGGAFVQGLRVGGIASCVKHFPGIASSGNGNRYPCGPGAEKTKYDLEDHELVPFRRGVAHDGLDSIMLAHSILHRDEKADVVHGPKNVVHGLLRRQLGYRGVVVSDCSNISLSNTRRSAESSIIAIETGSDMIIVNDQLPTLISTIEGIYKAFIDGILRVDMMEGASERISTLKKYYLNWEVALGDLGEPIISSLMLEHQILARKAYEASITVVRSDRSIMSVFSRLQETDIVLLLTPVVRPICSSNDTSAPIDPFECFGRALALRHKRVRHVPYTLQNGITSFHVAFIKRATAVVLGTCNSIRPHQSPQIRNVKVVQAACGSKPLVALAACDPCDLLDDKSFPTYICTYEYTKPALETAASIIFGERHAPGVLPISVPGSQVKRPQHSWKVDIWEKRRDAFSTADLWNNVIGRRWPMDAATLSSLLDRPGFSKHYIVRSLASKELLGLCATYFTPRSQGEIIGSLALLLVRPTHLNQGVGLSLHNVAVRELSNTAGIVSMQLGSIFPRFFPGLPVDLAAKDLDWFSHRGWNLGDDKFVYDLFLDMEKDERRWQAPPDSALKTTAGESDDVPISFSACQPGQFPALLTFEQRFFSPHNYPGWLEKYRSLKVTDDIADIVLATIPTKNASDQSYDTTIVGAALVYSPIGNSQVAKDIPWPKAMGEKVGGIACVSVHRMSTFQILLVCNIPRTI
jgi:beta-N-acetylhexosaminidase